MTEEKNILPPDLFSRNTIIAYLVRKLLHDNEKLRALDVGGFEGQLNLFLPQNTDLTILDKKPKPKDYHNDKIEYRQADANKIPYSDNCFDIVISSDLLEHVEKPFRAPAIREMIRTSKNFVIIGFPCQSDILEKAEHHIREQYKKITGNEHPFLIEHSKYGLPREEKIEKILKKENINFMKVKEGNLMNWYIQQLYTGAQHGEDLSEKTHSFYKFFNENLKELGNLRTPTYRTFFVISKKGELPEEEISNELSDKYTWNSRRFMELLEKAFNDLRSVIEKRTTEKNKVYESYTNIVHSFEKADLEYKKTSDLLVEREALIQKAKEKIHDYRETAIEVRSFLQEKAKTIQFLKNILEEKDKAIVQLEEKEKSNQEEINKQVKFIKHLSEEIEKKDKHAHWLEGHAKRNARNIERKNKRIRKLETGLETASMDLKNHQEELQKVINSKAWKLIMAYSAVKKALKKGFGTLFYFGPKVFAKKVIKKIRGKKYQTDKTPYDIHLAKNALTLKDKQSAKKEIKDFKYQPIISIITPVYNVNEKWLKKAIESVKDQWYQRWELCLCDDASTEEHIRPMLEKYAREDSRIKVVYRQHNGGIVKASNGALKASTGSYVGFLDNDDKLVPNALYEVVKALQEVQYDLIYSDEDKLDLEDETISIGFAKQEMRCDPFFKPDWSPDLLLSHNYICHFAVYKRKIVKQLGGLREGFDGSQDYDLVLRFTEKTQSIKHIPKILYHWRKIPGSTAAEVNAKPYVFEAAKKALRGAARRRGITGEVIDGIWAGSYRLKRKIEGEPLVSIIIPFKDKVKILKQCIESIMTKSTYKNYQLVLVDNRSEQLETEEYLQTLKGDPRVMILRYWKPFNFSAINNFAAKKAKGRYLLLLNNDTEVISQDWIESMLEHAQRQEVGAVGAKLLFPNKLVQHAGVLVGVGGIANSAFLKNDGSEHGYFGQTNIIKNYSAVTGACMMVNKDVYKSMGGLNEKDLGITFNDVDFCLRLRKKGYLIVYTPYAQLYHYESLSRGYDVAMNEIKYMQQRYGSLIKRGDPYYNPNLSQERFDFSLKVEDTP